jgi:hypothetical protein
MGSLSRCRLPAASSLIDRFIADQDWRNLSME